MRLLFEMDKRDYESCTCTFVRHSARSIVIRDGMVAMVHAVLLDHYKFPGGGIRDGENPVDAMIRETREEAGLVVLPDSIRPYGYVHRVERSEKYPEERFLQDNFYYLCDAETDPVAQNLDAYEAEEGYQLEWVTPETAIRTNRRAAGTDQYRTMLEREALVLELLRAEGYFS